MTVPSPPPLPPRPALCLTAHSDAQVTSDYTRSPWLIQAGSPMQVASCPHSHPLGLPSWASCQLSQARPLPTKATYLGLPFALSRDVYVCPHWSSPLWPVGEHTDITQPCHSQPGQRWPGWRRQRALYWPAMALVGKVPLTTSLWASRAARPPHPEHPLGPTPLYLLSAEEALE